ncbi:MAG: substrate-binding domain-containing protein [Butyricicoccus sp.]|nr:substrate-binding domain-containing protein [Butyricicoccus sp.]
MSKKNLFKRICSAPMASALILTVTACGGSGAASVSGEAAAGGEKVKIGVAIQTLKANVYTVMQESAMKKAEELGVELLYQSCELNAATQKSQIETMLGQGIQALVIEPADADSMAATAKMVRDMGIPVINLEQRISNFDSDLWLVGDSYTVGQMQVEEFIKVWGEDKPANIVLLCGTAGDEIAESISRGVRETAAKYDNLTIVVDQQVPEWDRQKAMNYMEDAIVQTGGDINVVIANNDNMALGARKAAENAGIADDIWFIGADNDEELNQGILDGKKLMTVDKGAILQGERMVEAALNLINGVENPVDKMDGEMPVWFTPVQMVTAETIEEVSGPKFPHLFQ